MEEISFKKERKAMWQNTLPKDAQWCRFRV